MLDFLKTVCENNCYKLEEFEELNKRVKYYISVIPINLDSPEKRDHFITIVNPYTKTISTKITIYDADVATTYSVLRELVLYNIKNSIIVVLNTKDGYSIINNLMAGPLSNSVFYTLKTRKDKLNICEQEYPVYGLRYTHKLQKEQPKDEDFGLYIAKVAMKNNQ